MTIIYNLFPFYKKKNEKGFMYILAYVTVPGRFLYIQKILRIRSTLSTHLHIHHFSYSSKYYVLPLVELQEL